MKIPVISKWIHWRVGQKLKEYKLQTVVDIGGIGRLKNFVPFRVTDANIRSGINATNMPFENSLFDASVSINTIEHVKDKKKFLSEAVRVSRVVSIHWFPYGAAAQRTEKLKKKLGHNHPCSLPEYQDLVPFLNLRVVNSKFNEVVNCRDHLLMLASINEKINVEETFRFIEMYGNNPYGYMLTLELRQEK